MGFKQSHPDHVRNEAIRRVKAGESKNSVARALGIHIETICRWTPEVSSRRPHDRATRDAAIQRVLAGEPKATVANSMGIGRSTLDTWTANIKRKNTYSEETKALIRRRVLGGEMKIAVARDLGVSITSVQAWTADIKIANRLTPEIRTEVIRRIEQGELKTKVARELGISLTRARALTKHVQNGKIPDHIRQVFIGRINSGEPLAEVARSMKISRARYREWVTIDLMQSQNVSEKTKQIIVQRHQQGEKIAVLSKEFSVPTIVIRVWLRIANGGNSAFPSFPREEKDKAIQRVANGEQIKNVAKTIGATSPAVCKWVRDAKKAGLISFEKPKPKYDDREFIWINRQYPHLSDWRASMAEWLKGEPRGISNRISSLATFVSKYLDALKLPTTRAEFLRKGTLLPSFANKLQSSKHASIKTNNIVHHFLNWVLLNYFSEDDNDGKPVVSPEFRNPIPLLDQNNGLVQRTESVRDVLPYGFIVQLRERLIEGHDFRDWKFAQSALGFETLKSANALADWFPVTENCIDKMDPDCVWRLRERLNKHPVLEMWSPVRWVAMLLKLQLPARTGQIRVLDSGESDTWRYENGGFIENDRKLAHRDLNRPWQQGVFRRTLGSDNESRAILYFNSNKTADAFKSGPHKGFECPWPHFPNITENPYYWLEKLRNWQEKYNPIQQRTKWAELPASRGLSAKSDAQLASYPDACFLFRTPETPRENHMPITNGMLANTWQKLMTAFELDLAKKKVMQADGSPVVLNNPETGRTYYPPHGLRVSLITAMVITGNIGPELMMKIVGHSRLVMTLYYTKPGYSHLKDAIVDAAERLEARKDESIIRFLSSASNEEMLNRVIFNAENWQTVIAVNPAHRNPVGWLLMHDGICFAGGNTTVLDDNSRVPGCHNGGSLINAKEGGTYGPVPGGPMNCSLCRWKAAEKHHVPALVATLNNQLYYLHQEQDVAVKHSDSVSALKRQKAREESSGQPFTMARDLKTIERLYETSMDRLSNLAASIAGTLRMIQRLEQLSDAASGTMVLVSAGDLMTANTILQDIDSELLQLSEVCHDVEIYPDLNPGKAVFRRSQLLDIALKRESESPFFTQLSEADQLKYGNAFMRAIASKADPSNPILGRREVVSLMDKGESLQQFLGIKLCDFISQHPNAPLHLTV